MDLAFCQNFGFGLILLFFMWQRLHLLSGSDAGSDDIRPSSSIVIQNHQAICFSRCPTYGARLNNVVCGLLGCATPAIRQGTGTNENTPNANPLVIEHNTSCSGQAYSKGPSTGSRNENMECGFTFGVLRVSFITLLLSRVDA